MTTLSAPQLATLRLLAQHGGWMAADELHAGLGTLRALYRRKLVYRQANSLTLWARWGALWRINDAGKKALENSYE